MNNYSRDFYLDQVRCFANYLIVVMHASAALQYCQLGGAEFEIWTFVCGCVTQMALPALFIISGYLLFKNYSIGNYYEKIKRRVKRLFVPYVIWNTTFVLFYLICGKMVPRLAARVSSFSLDSIGGAFSKVLSLTVHPIDGPLWFLRTLFALSIASPVIYYLVKLNNKLIRYSFFFIILAAYTISFYYGITDKLLMTYPLYAIMLFYIGGLLATSGNSIETLKFNSAYWLIPYIIGLSMVTVVVYHPGYEHSPLGATMNDLGKLLLTPALFYFVSKLDNKKLNNSRLFGFAKDMSFFAYAGHFLFCSMIMHTLASYTGFISQGRSTILILAFCCIGVPVMALIYILGKKTVPKLMKLYDGTL